MTKPVPRWHSFRSPLLIVSVVAVGVTLWLGIIWYNCPFTRSASIKALEEQSGKSVRIGAFRSTFSPLGYVAENITFFDARQPNQSPELTVRKLVVIARPIDLLVMRKRVERISITGLRASVLSQNGADRKQSGPRFSEIGNIHLEDSQVKFLSSESDADPLTFAAKKFDINEINQTGSGSFGGELALNKPQGRVRVSGQIGPWDWKSIGRTPIRGSFAMSHADLAKLDSLAGSANASGRFSGPLAHISCSGTADVPDFKVSDSSHSVDLATAFKVNVDGLTGDTILDHVESHFNRTVIQSQGIIRKDGEHPGKTAFLRLSIEEGQVGDVLLLFTREPQPSMDGTVDLRMDVELPSGPPGFLRALKLNGDFGIDRGRFNKASAQAPITHLSESASGMKKNARDRAHRTVLSDVAGHISAQHGLATLSHITFAVPGAHGILSGTYNLLSQSVNLEGHLTTTGELSSTSSGFKAVVLKILTPLMKKNSLTVVPFVISGTAKHPDVSLNLLKKLHL